MKNRISLFSLFLLIGLATSAQKSKLQSQTKEVTFCNPMDINYRFQPSVNETYFREAADPLITIYKGKYLLFASHSGGYWYSENMQNWKYIPIKSLPIEDYAPDVTIKGDTIFYMASKIGLEYIYHTTNPFEDSWKAKDQMFPISIWDPHFFRDDDNKLYLYWGCSNFTPIKVVQLNENMQPITEPIAVIEHNIEEHGWEVFPSTGKKEKKGFNEGAWMTKYNNKYYLQYASSGTQFKVYGDGVYKSDSPLGPFKYEPYSPFSYKPGGFISGAGHSSTFQDKYGNYWHVSSMVITKRNDFERRLGLFPAAFDKDGVLHTYTAFGDYPTKMPTRKIDFEKEDLFKGWMLLSYNKKLTASSSLENFPVANATDENIQTWWSAKTGGKDEWLCLELDDKVTVNAIQVNFADNDAKLTDKSKNLEYCYRILASNDKKSWRIIADKSRNTKDACHEYIELEKPVKTKYVKIENVKVPDGKFSIYDFRVFGLKNGKKPQEVNNFEVKRDTDARKAIVSWKKDISATGYVINYGVDSNKLYTSYMVYDSDSVKLTGLNKGVSYYFTIDAFNESGISKGQKIIMVK
ncbi:MAG TPA: family 43 glycosylhydrolase [Flavobacterium sp.]|uniref:family 43 glycosylhydrolase n=1 Tax=Flavobacterium TaxID=237 RepID=UPI002ED245FF